LIALVFTSCIAEDKKEEDSIVYNTPESLEKFLYKIYKKHSKITYMEPVGVTVEGRTIWGLIISDRPLESETEPRIRLTGSIHGDENITTEILIHLIDYITNNYDNKYIKTLVNTRQLFVIPMINPDGVANNTRYNLNNVDLNRNFSVEWTPHNLHGGYPFSEPESKALRDYSLFTIFHLSLTFHSGAVIVNMPFDYASMKNDNIIPLEYFLVKHLAKIYTTTGSFLESEGLLVSENIDMGTINGGDWYIINGSLQDWSYKDTGCIDLTVEITKRNPLTIKGIKKIFRNNIKSILAYIDSAGMGVYGKITDENNNPVFASISIEEGDIITHSDDYGCYHRILLPGQYTLLYMAEGFKDYAAIVFINEESSRIEKNVIMEKN